jgi:hypothetical protein
VETTGQAEHTCNTPSSGTRPETRHPRPPLLGYTPRWPLPVHPSPWRHSPRPPGRPSDAQCHSLQQRQPARQRPPTGTVLVGPATPRRWRQPARRNTPASRRARAHAQRHGNNPRPTRLGCTPRRPLHPQRHSLHPPGRPSNAQCHSLQQRTGLAEDDLCPVQLGYTPLRPPYPQRQTIQRGQAQQHSLQPDNWPSRQ